MSIPWYILLIVTSLHTFVYFSLPHIYIRNGLNFPFFFLSNPPPPQTLNLRNNYTKELKTINFWLRNSAGLTKLHFCELTLPSRGTRVTKHIMTYPLQLWAQCWTSLQSVQCTHSHSPQRFVAISFNSAIFFFSWTVQSRHPSWRHRIQPVCVTRPALRADGLFDDLESSPDNGGAHMMPSCLRRNTKGDQYPRN